MFLDVLPLPTRCRLCSVVALMMGEEFGKWLVVRLEALPVIEFEAAGVVLGTALKVRRKV